MQIGVDRLREFSIFADLSQAESETIARIARIETFPSGTRLTTEGAPAEHLYLFLRGVAVVKVTCPDGKEGLVDEVGPGEILGWSAVTEPYRYTATATTSKESQAIVLDGPPLRELFESNHGMGYQVLKGIGDVISRRYGRAIVSCGSVRERDLCAFQGEERVIWDNGELQLTSEAVLIGMNTDSPNVLPLEVIYDVTVSDGCVVLHVKDGDVRSPVLERPEDLAALVHDEIRRTRFAYRR